MSGKVLGQFLGDDKFPIEWASDAERDLLWIYDDLHIPQPVSPMFFDIGGWWLTCDHMFRRFATPFAADWIAKKINGYVYTAAIPADPAILVDSAEYDARYVARVPRDPAYPAQMGPYLGAVLPVYATNFLTWWRDQVRTGEILVCQMTNPAWVVLFTKIAGLVTDAGGAASHPAVVSREFGIPAVVGTSVATQRIKTGDRIRVNGSTGLVEILS
jgi:phosphohistidine swiveling domain-containing protein